MIAWLTKAIQNVKDSIRYKEQVSPETIRQLAAELCSLAQMAEMFAHQETAPLDRIKKIQTETGQLIELTGRAEFRRLSVQRRIELHESLIASKRHLINSMQSTPAATETLQ